MRPFRTFLISIATCCLIAAVGFVALPGCTKKKPPTVEEKPPIETDMNIKPRDEAEDQEEEAGE